MSTSAPVRVPGDLSANGRRPVRSGYGRLPRGIRWGVPALVVLALVGFGISRALPQAAPPPTAVATPVSRLIAHGTIVPVSQARVGTLGGGVLTEMSVGIGTTVEGQRELARVRGPAGIEVLTAPFAGTVTGQLANLGDTIVPGAGVVMVADLSRLQVRTNDVDEFLIGRVAAGQNVVLQVEALDGRELVGRVQTVALQPQTTSAGDEHYPVTIDLGGTTPDLRPGMSVRVLFPS